jgi:cell division protein FtsL
MKRYFPIWIFPALIAMAALTVWLRLTIVRASYEIDQASKLTRNAQQEYERLKFKVARLKSPRHLEQLSRAKFSLGPPRQDQVIPMREDGS